MIQSWDHCISPQYRVKLKKRCIQFAILCHCSHRSQPFRHLFSEVRLVHTTYRAFPVCRQSRKISSWFYKLAIRLCRPRFSNTRQKYCIFFRLSFCRVIDMTTHLANIRVHISNLSKIIFSGRFFHRPVRLFSWDGARQGHRYIRRIWPLCLPPQDRRRRQA